ncbi:MAG TPA: zinc ribbon domain-containing protein [Gemmata sp.]|jgi:ribosomal protein L40E|nr:zinc ribbon domain-containing protein [Gemmata sp.]
MPQLIDPQHDQTRDILRVVGPTVVVVGVIFTVIGVGSFFSSFGTFEPPRYFWCAFVGLPLIGFGGIICKFAFLGSVSRYMANEIAPVGKDVVNYMAEGTKGAVHDVAAAVAGGLQDGMAGKEMRILHCHKCNADNEAPANFCKACGSPFAKAIPCPECGKLNDPDARFCGQCGKSVEAGKGAL